MDTLHIVARDLRFLPGKAGATRDKFEVIGTDGEVEAVIYMAAQNETNPADHIVS